MSSTERTPLKADTDTAANGQGKPAVATNLGAKTIGLFGSIALTVNNSASFGFSPPPPPPRLHISP
jgi:hypothetical protein